MSDPLRDSGETEVPAHRPVLVREVIQFLDLKPGQVVVDGTVGAGGHAQKILEHIGSEGTLIGLDRDPMMLRLAGQFLNKPNCHLIQASYSDLQQVLIEQNIEHVDRILLDVGLSSDQLADSRRGFGFDTGGPLDLRFDTSSGIPAWQLIEQSSEAELTEIFQSYGEERFSRRIAGHLVARRSDRPVRTAADLVEAVQEAVGKRISSRSKKHPATRVFQALRIQVNDELSHLERMMENAMHGSLCPDGRAVVIAFHSLEDRLVKQAFRNKEQWQDLTRTPITASPAEIRINPRCRTAKLRAAVKK